MTTLPQTTPMRLPRPVAPAPLAIPAGIVPPNNAPNPMTGGDIWRVLRANAWLIAIVVGGMLALGVVANTWLAAKHPSYKAVGLFRVATDEEQPLQPGELRVQSGPSSQNIEIEQHDQANQIKQPYLLSKVLDNPQVRDTQWFKDFITVDKGQPVPDLAAAKQDLTDSLSVAPLPDSRLVSVSMTYSVPKDCTTIVTQLIQTFLDEKSQSRQDDQLKKTQALDIMRQQYEGDLKTKSIRINRIAEQMGDGGSTIYGPSAKNFELQSLIAEQVHVQEDANKALSQLQSFQEQLKDGGTPASVEELVERNSAYLEDQHIADEAEITFNELKGQLGETNPVVVRAKSVLDGWQEKVAAVREDAKVKAIAAISGELGSAASAGKQTLDAITKHIEQLRSEITELAKTRNEYENLLVDQKNLTDELEKVKQSQNMTANWFIGSGFSNASWASHPEIPDKPSFPRLPITLGVAVFLGLAVSLGIAFLREMTDTTVRSPRDIARVGQMNLLGMIPHESDDPQTAGARLPLAIFEAPHSIIAEQFRQVRTRLQHAASLDTTRSLLVTGCGPGDGKWTVACNLAAGLALNGRRILLVDVNFRRPELHNIFNFSNDVGFGDVLNAPELYEEAIHETEVPNLFVLTSGNKPSNPTELLESQLLIDFIERALEEYDHVIFDSGPLLIVSETIALAPRVDGVITVVRANGNSRGLLQRVRDQLRQLKAEHLGVILNAVRSQGGGYYGPMIKTYYAYHDGNGAPVVAQPVQ